MHEKDCETIADVVKDIERYEAILADGDKQKQPIRATRDERKNQADVRAAQSEMTQTLQQILSRLEDLESGQKTKSFARISTTEHASFAILLTI